MDIHNENIRDLNTMNPEEKDNFINMINSELSKPEYKHLFKK
jgi:hypothetical protein